MKDLNMIRATNKFQDIIDRYHKNNNSKLLSQKKLKNSLNYLFLQDLNQVRKHKNFSDEEYMINEIKNENKKKTDNKMKNNINYIKSPELNISNEKISKDIFFYYRKKIEENSEKDNRQNNINNFRYNAPSHRLISGKLSAISNNTSKTRNQSRKKTNPSLVLPLINSRNYDSKFNKYNNKSFISDDETIANIMNNQQSEKYMPTEISIDINNDSLKNEKDRSNIYNSRINKDISKRRNKSNTIEVENLLKNSGKKNKSIFYRIQLPFIIHNDIYNKINKVTQKSENISKSINYISTEGNIAYENEKNRIKFLSDIING